MTTSASSDKSTGSDDLKITYESNGETVTRYISRSSVDSKNRGELAKALAGEAACFLCCSGKASFVACFARCVDGDGKCCDGGKDNCEDA